GDIHNRLNGYVDINNFSKAPPADPAGCSADPNACTTAFGTLGRNIYRGPFQQNWDFSVIKNFRISERQTLRFTTDFFNLWNHANFASPASNDLENPNAFGKITSTVGTPRLIQFSLRWAFKRGQRKQSSLARPGSGPARAWEFVRHSPFAAWRCTHHVQNGSELARPRLWLPCLTQ